jgi:hypothetical protein
LVDSSCRRGTPKFSEEKENWNEINLVFDSFSFLTIFVDVFCVLK